MVSPNGKGEYMARFMGRWPAEWDPRASNQREKSKPPGVKADAWGTRLDEEKRVKKDKKELGKKENLD